jgi:hypothetical protein
MKKDYLTTQQCAAMAGISVPAFMKHLQAGHIKGERFAHVWTIHRNDMAEFITARALGQFTGIGGRPRKSK